MNRVIKFRAWDEIQKLMLDNDTLSTWTMKEIHSQRDVVHLMQFTGLLDKNGKEIYEGDVVMLDGSNEPKTIEFYNGAFSANAAHLRGIYGGAEAYRMEIIGNIYENPELTSEPK